MLLNRTEYPSWLYPVTKGATTIWERWDGIKTDGTFQNAGMNSFNHYAYGAVGNWMYRTITGINQSTPGFKTFSVHPEIGGDLTYANATYESMYGQIKSGWKLNDDHLEMNVSVPANTVARILIPAEAEADVTENGKPLGSSEDFKIIDTTDGYVVIQAGSGDYHFVVNK
jgi:alpha-L-rhamnosidase